MVTTAAQPPDDLSFGLGGETESTHVRDSREETAEKELNGDVTFKM